MSDYISINNINQINAELTNYCNAACPMCPRFDVNLNLQKDITNNSHTTLQLIKTKISTRVLSNLRTFRSCGNLGDGSMNPECLEIYDYVKSYGPPIMLLNTNGGARTSDFWEEMAKLGVVVTFSIDGLSDTNHLYRRNVKWEKLMNNVNAFIQAGGIAEWDYLIFKHNEHQVDEAIALSKKLGFKKFNKKYTTRWDDFDSDGNWITRTSINIADYKLEKPSTEIKSKESFATQKTIESINMTKKINCYSFHNNNSEIYIAANGNISPCCWLGDLKIHEAKNIIKNYQNVNLNYATLEQILEGDFFKQLWNGIQGLENSYRLNTCYHTCGVRT